MVSICAVAGGQAIFESKCMFSQLRSTIKVKSVDKMMQNACLYVILLVKHKNYHFLPFYLISNTC